MSSMSSMSSRASDPSVDYLRRPLGASLSYWCVRPGPVGTGIFDQIRKTRTVAVHATLPLLLSIELEQKTVPTINLWNYELHQLIWTKSCANIYADSNEAPSRKPAKFQPSFVRRRSSYNEQSSMEFHTESIVNSSVDDILASNKIASGAVGVIKDVKFGDPNASFPRGGNITSSSSASSSITNNSLRDMKIVVLCEGFIMVYHISSRRRTIVTPQDLRKTPSAVEVLDDCKLCVGCTDGSVKIFNLQTHSVEGSVQVLQKEISAVRLLPPKM
jgi:hypothetical protein